MDSASALLSFETLSWQLVETSFRARLPTTTKRAAISRMLKNKPPKVNRPLVKATAKATAKEQQKSLLLHLLHQQQPMLLSQLMVKDKEKVRARVKGRVRARPTRMVLQRTRSTLSLEKPELVIMQLVCSLTLHLVKVGLISDS
jgi:hypothetical protein